MTKQNKGRKLFAVSASAALVASAIVPVASANADFTDASKISAYAKEAVEYFSNEGVINGYEDGSFKPAAAVKRGEAAKMFAEGLGLSAEGDSDLTDISKHWAKEFINAVAEAGIVNGYEDGSFKPEKTLTRAETAKMIVEALGIEEEGDISKFTDVKGHWSEEYIVAAVGAGVLTGKTTTTMDPDGNVTREQFAAMLYRAFDYAGLLDVEQELTLEEALADLEAAVEAVAELGEVTVENKAAAQAALAALEAAIADVESFESEDEEILSAIASATKLAGELEKAIDAAVEVTEAYSIKVTPVSTTVAANGADNTVIKFELLDESGKVDTNADNLVLEISTTFGNLATNRVTVQDGVGQVVLSSEFSTKEVTAKITAQVIEAAADYKDLIGKLAGEASVKFVPASVTTDPNAVTFQDAESNQADRVVLYFDKPVSSTTFVKVDKDGNFVTTADKKEQILKDEVTIKVSQNGVEKNVVGIVPVAGNDKAVEVLLDKATTLIDNAKVELDVKIGTTRNQRDFTLTDARQPEFTGVNATNLRTLELKFSESVLDGNFSIDGVWTAGTHFDVELGEFDAVKGIDYRDTAKVKLKNVGGTTGQLYFAAGTHSITVTQLKDFAAATDSANVSTTQTLNFNVTADVTAPTAEVIVESPEQIRVKFNKDIEKRTDLEALFNNALKVYDEEAKQWVALSAHSKSAFKTANILVAEQVSDNEIVVELKDDWTNILTVATDAYYNYQFKFEFDKDVFTSSTNGIKNAKLDLNLSYTGSALTSADNVSPVIEDITQQTNPSEYVITMNEPVKLPGKDNAGDTVGKNQPNLPAVYAEFQGKDKDGKAVVIPATVVDYTDRNKADKQFKIKTTDAQALQTLVDEKGYSENWTVVVRSISDDIGNTAATLTRDFTVKSTTVAKGFLIQSHENDLTNAVFAFDGTKAGEKDRLEVTFTKGVNVAGPDNLTSVYNWTLNGTKLSNLSNVESIKVENVYGTEKDGYEKVIITFTDDRAFGASSNVVSVTKGIKSLDGTVLTGEYEVVAVTLPISENPIDEARKALNTEITSAKAADKTGKTEESVKALEDAIAAAEAVAAKAGATVKELEDAAKAVKDAVAALEDEKEEEVTGVELSTIAANGANKTEFGTFVSAVDSSKLTGDLAGATSLTLVIGDKEYTATVNGTYFLFTVPAADVADAAAVLAGKVIAK